MVNFIRTHASSPEEFRLPTAAFWDDDKYLKPLEFEEWLMFGMCFCCCFFIGQM